MEQLQIDHLFRHQHGKMVSILSSIFGLEHLVTIEDAVQDTFIKALKTWRQQIPENPEAWLTTAAKNRVIDLFRKIDSEKAREVKIYSGASSYQIEDWFLESEVEDSQLRMIFKACHPSLDPREQIAFSLKTISGFSTKEIATALMAQEETIKKRLQRARKKIIEQSLAFEIPHGKELIPRMDRVLEVLYLIFTEGFHSNKKDKIVRHDLCGEALRLCKMLLKKENLRSSKVYAVFALMCFHAARLDSKVNDNNEIINLKNQERSKWDFPLVALGDSSMAKSMDFNEPLSSYHYEAAIASEHLSAPSFEQTNWENIKHWYIKLHELQPYPNTKLSLAIVHLQLKDLKEANHYLSQINQKDFGKRAYLYYSTMSDYCHLSKDRSKSIAYMDKAINTVSNESELAYLRSKKESL